ncbi:Ketopantoate reductase ApbA/PanE [Macrophomina phaseolina MS6]|uniref:2-dehydropantoate 2-reductase n=2 Tax=Macrophomina phaseolina TaxID=35725 RepID=K2SNZ4_MACPH|nr:Ketopantoate reductase ApbA/PanE [Macrophomina phaseolina MS6]KAH7065529.1 ketopantoate reductase PanE/ApbA-domain-containing protein [Macrophomina phaseolina]
MARVLIFGAGSIGSVYAWVLTRAGADVTCVCRSNYTHVREHGFSLDSDVFGTGLHVRPTVVDRATAPPVDAPWDFILVCTKAFPGADPSGPSLVAPAVASPRTAIVLIQNGIGIEDEWHQAFPQNPILSGVVYLPATTASPGVTRMGNLERLEVGAFPATPVAEATPLGEFMELVQRGGATILVYDDIQPRRWSKMLVNATAWDPAHFADAAPAASPFADSPAPPGPDFVWSVMQEIVRIAQACGYAEITDDEARHQLARAQARAGTNKAGEGNVLADVKAGRPLEIEAIVGNAIKIAQEKGVPVPSLIALYALAQGLDKYIDRRHSV